MSALSLFLCASPSSAILCVSGYERGSMREMKRVSAWNVSLFDSLGDMKKG